MHEELLRLEYEHYDVDADDTITGRDFAHSMLSCVDLAKVDTYLDRAAKLPSNLASVKVKQRVGQACNQRLFPSFLFKSLRLHRLMGMVRKVQVADATWSMHCSPICR